PAAPALAAEEDAGDAGVAVAAGGVPLVLDVRVAPLFQVPIVRGAHAQVVVVDDAGRLLGDVVPTRSLGAEHHLERVRIAAPAVLVGEGAGVPAEMRALLRESCRG